MPQVSTRHDNDRDAVRKATSLWFQRIEEALGIAVIRHNEKKPGGLGEVLARFKVGDLVTLCMVGDRLLTDVVFGNLYGMLTVHTLPLCKGNDNNQDSTVAKVIRSVENTGLY